MERIVNHTEGCKIPTIAYKISKADTDVADDEVADYANILNGVAYQCEKHGYTTGWRNEMIVNMTVASYMLGLEPEDVLDDFVTVGLIDCSDDDEDPYDRLARVLDYKRRYSWDWMIDASWWSTVGGNAVADKEFFPLTFDVVD